MKKSWIFGLLPLLALIALPFWLRPAAEERFAAPDADRIVIYTPNTESMKREFEVAFRRHYREKFGRDIMLDFRSPGGTADIVRYIDDRYTTAFRQLWEEEFDGEWNGVIATAFKNSRLGAEASAEERAAREAFLGSEISIGADLFWGGGTYDHRQQADKGYGVDARIAEDHPEYFVPSAMAAELSGERIYDPEGRYYGACLASFGICYNPDRVAELTPDTPPASWEDLAAPRFYGLVVVADPTKSGSIAKCFELIVQQGIAETVAAGGDLNTGWAVGMNRVKRLVANAGTVSESASVVTNLVARGEAAAGMAIDFYAMSAAEWLSQQTGEAAPIVYTVPHLGSAVSPDPVQLLRGAPNREAAREFIVFMLSLEGQKLFNFRLGTPGGPEKNALRRAPVRRELYEEPWLQYRSDPDYNPYRDAGDVVYRPEWTGVYFNLLRVLIRCTMLDVQDELAVAWGAIVAAGGPEAVPEAYRVFSRLPFDYDEAPEIRKQLDSADKQRVAALRRQWAVAARDQYLEAARLAREGR